MFRLLAWGTFGRKVMVSAVQNAHIVQDLAVALPLRVEMIFTLGCFAIHEINDRIEAFFVEQFFPVDFSLVMGNVDPNGRIAFRNGLVKMIGRFDYGFRTVPEKEESADADRKYDPPEPVSAFLSGAGASGAAFAGRTFFGHLLDLGISVDQDLLVGKQVVRLQDVKLS